QGAASFDGAKDGYDGGLNVRQRNFGGSWTDDFSLYLRDARFEILAAGQQVSRGFRGTSLYADDLNAIGAPRMLIGTTFSNQYGQNGRRIGFGLIANASAEIILRQGAVLQAAEVMLATEAIEYGGIVVEAGAGINTVGQGRAPYGEASGYVYEPDAG